MADTNRVGDLEINQDLTFQQLSWKLQRIGWSLMLLVLCVAFVGLIGAGPLSLTTARDTSSLLEVEYNRFERYQSPATLKIRVAPGAAQKGQLRLWINRDYLEKIELERVDPEPESVELGGKSTAFVFKVLPQQDPLTIIYHLEPNARGRLPLRIGLHGGPQVEISQLIYP